RRCGIAGDIGPASVAGNQRRSCAPGGHFLKGTKGRRFNVSMQSYDLVVVGGGIIGLATAREWIRRHPDSRVCVLEKEPAVARHASGRNSGVLHAGFYYSADSLKARFTLEGNRAMT